MTGILFHFDGEVILLAFSDNNEFAIGIGMGRYRGFDITNLFTVHPDGAVLHIFPCLALGFFHAALHQSFHDINRCFMDFAALGVAESPFDFIARKFLDVAGEESLGHLFRLGQPFFAVNEAGHFFSQLPLSASMFRMFCYFFFQCVDFLMGRKVKYFRYFTTSRSSWLNQN